jgi:hypothetical protein
MLAARTIVAPSTSRSSAADATCASACTPASVRPAPATVTRFAFEHRQRVFDQPLDRDAFRLTLPSDERGAVVRERQLEMRHLTRPPGASRASDRQAGGAQGHDSG